MINTRGIQETRVVALEEVTPSIKESLDDKVSPEQRPERVRT